MIKKLIVLSSLLAGCCVAYWMLFKPAPALAAIRSATSITIKQDDYESAVLTKKLRDPKQIRAIVSVIRFKTTKPCECGYMDYLEFETPDGPVRIAYSGHSMIVKFNGSYERYATPPGLTDRVVAMIGDDPRNWHIREWYKRQLKSDE